jgi:Carboxypeptidase regulatory-like domain
VKSFLLVLCSLMFSFGTAHSMSPRSTGSISGTVYDSSGAIIDSAKVEVKDADGGTQRADTDSQGNYSVSGLEAGTYVVIISASGYESFEKDDFELRDGDDSRLDANLVPEKLDSDNNSNASQELSQGALLVETASALWPR